MLCNVPTLTVGFVIVPFAAIDQDPILEVSSQVNLGSTVGTDRFFVFYKKRTSCFYHVVNSINSSISNANFSISSSGIFKYAFSNGLVKKKEARKPFL